MVKTILTFLSNFRRYCACAVRKYTKIAIISTQLSSSGHLLLMYPHQNNTILLPNIFLIKIHDFVKFHVEELNGEVYFDLP